MTAGAVSPGWNEALSLSSAAEVGTSPAEGFVAFAGREYTTNDRDEATRARGGPEDAADTRSCCCRGPPTASVARSRRTEQGPENVCDETELYDWVEGLGGIIIQAHPQPVVERQPTPLASGRRRAAG